MSGGVARVGVNLTWLVPGVVGGSEEATLAAMGAAGERAAAAGIEMVMFGLSSLRRTYPEFVDRFEFHEFDLDGRNKLGRVIAENTTLRRRASRAGLRIIHHAGGVVPPGVRLPSTLAIHDTQPLDLPQNFSWAKRRYLGTMIGRSTRAAIAVTVPSIFVKHRLIMHTGVDADRVTVVPWSVTPMPTPTAGEVDGVVARHGLVRPFVLYPAITYPHKNHSTLLEAIARLSDVDLVLTGAAGPLDAEVAERVSRADLAGRVHMLGRIPRPDLSALMAAASVVAVPSLYEGFGLPALESIVAGRPTVVADAGSLPEVVGEAALVVPPCDVGSWAEAISAALADPSVAARLVEAGRAVTASCTPQRTGAGLIDVWLRAIASISSPPTPVPPDPDPPDPDPPDPDPRNPQ